MSNAQAFEKLRRMRAELKRLPAVNVAIATQAAPAVTSLARGSWAAGTSVYGVPYEPKKDGSTRTLRRSGALGAQIRFVPQGTMMRCMLGVPYARYHIKHGLLPRGGSPLPTSWQDRIKRIAEIEIGGRLGRV